MDLFKTATKGIAWSTVSTVVRSLVSLLQVAILTRFIPKEDFGIVAIATLFINFTQIFLDLGLSSGILYKQEISSKEYSSLFWFNILSGLLLTSLLLSCSRLISRIYSEGALKAIIPLLSLTIFFSSLGCQHRTVQQKKMRFKTIAIIEILAVGVALIVAIVLAITGFGIYSLIISTLANAVVANVLFLIIGLKEDKNISFHFVFKETLPFLKIGLYSTGSQVLDFFSREVDTIIISAAFSKEQLGLYTLCKRLVTALYGIVSPVVNKVLPPLLVRFQNNVDELRSTYYRIIQSAAIVVMPVFCLVACFPTAILSFVYGDNYVEGAFALSLLALYYGLLAPGCTITSLQIATGRTDAGFYWTIARVIINSLAILIGSRGGVEGMVLVLIIVNFLSSPISWLLTVRPILNGAFWPYLKQSLSPSLLAVFISTPFFCFYSKSDSLGVSLLFGVIYLIIYTTLVLFFFPKSYVLNKIRMCIRGRRLVG